MHKPLATEIERLRRQRDELLAALRNVLPVLEFEAEARGSNDLLYEIPAGPVLAAARAAIARAEYQPEENHVKNSPDHYASHALSMVRNFRACNAGVPAPLELEAIVETIMCGWDYSMVAATAARGVADADQQAIRKLIETEGLSVTPERAIRALLEECAGIVAAREAEEADE